MMSFLRRFLAFTALFILVCAPALHADDAAEAKRRFTEGTKALEAGRYREAALHFEAASRLRPHPFASFTAATTWDKAEDPARAADNFSRAVDLPGLSPKDLKVAKERLASLEESLGTASISGPSSVTVQFEGSTETNPPAKLHSTPGIHTLLIVRGDKVERRDVILKVGKTVEVDVSQESAAPPPTASAPAPTASTTATAPPTEPSSEPPSKGPSTRKLVGYGMAGLGVVSAGVAVALGFKTLSARDSYVANPTRDGYDSATSDRMWTNVAWGGALVLGGVGAALIFWPEGKKEDKDSGEEKASIRLAPAPGGIQIGGTF
ncbi:MAG: hypothetical protein HY898_00235 [Deltaproteobacteria bacterium]|nr:hypothetical protein [Deltaproteobacteria bacterium]